MVSEQPGYCVDLVEEESSRRGSNELGFLGPYLVLSNCVTTVVVREETESPSMHSGPMSLLLKTLVPRWK
jgi:hypothetical protein